MDENKKTALKILLLYMITSSVFLVLVCYGWYETKKDSILDSKIRFLQEAKHELIATLHETQQINLLEIPFALINRNGEIIFNTLPLLQDSTQIKEILDTAKNSHEKIIVSNDDMYLVTQRLGRGFRHFMNENFNNKARKDTLLILKVSGVKVELYTLLLHIITSFIVVLFLMSCVAYFLVLLSLKPLKDKINTLNSFIKDSTHEINTPLSVILMSIERIKINEMPQNQQQKLLRIQLAAKTLAQIYQDLLFYTFEEMKEVKRESVPLLELIKERATYFEPFFQKKNITLHFKEEKDSDKSHLLANYNHIARIIDNLLNNALKYTQSGGIVEITLSERFLRIKDNGCGIAKKDLPFIFKKYYRANKQQGGFGIGLALVKQICDSYEISIHCKSDVGNGSEFVLSW